MENIFLCLSGHSHSVTLVFKNIKNNSLSILIVSVWPLASCVLPNNSKKY